MGMIADGKTQEILALEGRCRNNSENFAETSRVLIRDDHTHPFLSDDTASPSPQNAVDAGVGQ